MSGDERLVRFKLLDQVYSFYTGASEEEMAAILALVRERFYDGDRLPKGTVPTNKVAMMACLKMASDYLRLEKEFANYRQATRSHCSKITEEIEQYL